MPKKVVILPHLKLVTFIFSHLDPGHQKPPTAGFAGIPDVCDCVCVLICVAVFWAWSPQKECLGWEWGQGWFPHPAKSCRCPEEFIWKLQPQTRGLGVLLTLAQLFCGPSGNGFGAHGNHFPHREGVRPQQAVWGNKSRDQKDLYPPADLQGNFPSHRTAQRGVWALGREKNLGFQDAAPGLGVKPRPGKGRGGCLQGTQGGGSRQRVASSTPPPPTPPRPD